MNSSSSDSSSPLAQADRWHFGFAGLMLLLFGLFAILYATSQRRALELEEEVRRLETRLREPEKPTPSAADEAPTSAAPAETAISVSQNESLRTLLLEEVGKLQTPAQARESWLETEARPDGGMLIRVLAPRLFEEGDVKVSAQRRPLIDKLGEAIRATGRRIRIEGYADDEDSEWILRQGARATVKNTWELSALRAAWIAQLWMQKHDFDPEKMEVQAYGRFRKGPRRLEIIIEKKEG